MSEARDMFALLRQSADGKVVDAIERLVAEGHDHQLCRINPLAFLFPVERGCPAELSSIKFSMSENEIQ